MKKLAVVLVCGFLISLVFLLFGALIAWPLLVTTYRGNADSGWALLATQIVLSVAAATAFLVFLSKVFATFGDLGTYFQWVYRILYLALLVAPLSIVILAVFVPVPIWGPTTVLFTVSGVLLLAITLLVNRVIPETRPDDLRDILFSKERH